MPRKASSQQFKLAQIEHSKADVASFVYFVRSFPGPSAGVQESVDDDGQRPTKRLKTSGGRDSIVVLRQTISFATFSEPIPAEQPQSFHVQRRDCGEFIKVEHFVPVGDPDFGHGLRIAPRRTAKGPRFFLCHRLEKSETPQSLITALDVASQGSDSTSEGCLWASIGVEVLQQGTRVDIKLDIDVHWNESSSVSAASRSKAQRFLRNQVLKSCFPSLAYTPEDAFGSLSPQDFYRAAHVPDKFGSDQGIYTANIPDLTAQLFPFQRRTLHWLLRREGVSWTKASESEQSLVHPISPDPSEVPISFAPAQDALGQTIFVSRLFGVATRDLSRYAALQNIRGGILAEEMGLGKTLEIIGLLLLHQRPPEPSLVFDPYLGRNLRPTGATLLITPSTLLDQWLSELERHAPHLKVMHYPGSRILGKNHITEEEMVQLLSAHDVVVTTFEVLRYEVHMAIEPPPRSIRRERKYERPKSPLVQLSWWRVCIDEAQMVENWTSNTATLARLIPRVNAWAITGTPVKDDIKQDLRGLLNFLRYEPYVSDTLTWNSLFAADRKSFHRLFNSISIRHTKAIVRDEIALPPQKRYVITMPFSAVEEEHYRTLFERLAKECGLDTSGNPIDDKWDPEDPSVQQAMRVALDRLRQTALHPEVGMHNRQALGRRAGPMRTVSEVLDLMLEQTESAIETEHRGLFNILLVKGQILAALNRVQEALQLWEQVEKDVSATVAERREELRKEVEQARVTDPGKTTSEQGEDVDSEEAAITSVKDARRRLRYALEIQHKAVFYCANAYYTIKSNPDLTAPDSEEFTRLDKLETEAYDRAKSIRKEILQESHSRAVGLMEKIASTAATQSFTVIPEVQVMDQAGIVTQTVVDALKEVGALLDQQADQLDEWREHTIQLLLKPLLDEESEDVTGEEYEESAKLQDELMVYLQLLRTLVADRKTALTGLRNGLVDHEANVSIARAKDDEGPWPKKMLELFSIRESLKPVIESTYSLGSLRGIVDRLTERKTYLEVGMRDGQQAHMELAIVNNLRRLAEAQLAEQSKITSALEREVDSFSNTMNARLEFYRQLQAVSDMVTDYDGPKTTESLDAVSRQAERAAKALSSTESKHRYLVHLKATESGGEEQRLCIICQCPFSIGVLTVCGHQFCKECIGLWFRAHHNCPMCKKKLDRTNLHDITLRPNQLQVRSETARQTTLDPTESPASKKPSIYSEFNPEKLAEIQNIELRGPDFTTKVNNLIRHLLWLRQSDPGAKSIVFSQYKDFLGILEFAFKRNGIGYTSFDQADGVVQFKEDVTVEVFLLHARAHSSGLNLVNAKHVFLCEPVLNTALELQAIARVDRIGQNQQSTVWLYIVEGTVEESIYNLSVQRRMEHMGRDLDGQSERFGTELLDENLDAANSFELQQAHLSRLMGKGKISGEAVDKKDLWTCLFGHRQSKPREVGEEVLRNEPAFRRFLTGEAAEGRRNRIAE
ncbi:hypothetical protein VTK73DRAFT_6052 [Phialemonium thermophilum]|uniref:Uncharacterized protein n=1 Tax=Phialemonium thermophilum TaxID=223376 RepID=A0ABR3XW41_9PEZI